MKIGRLVAFCDKGIEYSFYLLTVAVPLVVSPASYELFEFPKMLLVYTGAALILTFWASKILLSGKINFSTTPLFWPIVAFLTSQIISTIFSIDIITSIFGYYSRFNGGLLSTTAFVALYFAAVSNLQKLQAVRILLLAVATGLFTSLWGIASHYGADPTCKLLIGVWTSKCWTIAFDPTLRIFATFGQPNWMAGYLAMAILALVGLTLTVNKLRFQIFAVFANSVLFTAFLFTNSRSATLAFGASLLIFLASLTFLKFGRKLKFDFLPILATLTIFIILTLVFGQSLAGRVRQVKLSSNSSSQQVQEQPPEPPSSGPTESGQIRLIVWKGALEIFRHYPVTGSGVETFGFSYYQAKPAEHNLTSEWNFLYNKAHNEFLNYAATTGILGIGTYLAIILTYFLVTTRYIFERTNKKQASAPSSGRGKMRDKILILGLVAALISFQIHNFFGFSVVPTSLLLWLILASTILVRLPTLKVYKFKANKSLVFILVLFFFLSMFILMRFYFADLAFTRGISEFDSENYKTASEFFDKAVKTSPLPQPLFLSYSAYNSAILAAQDGDLTKQVERQANEAQKLSRFNLTVERLVTNTYLELSSANPQFSQKAKESALNLLKIAPTDAETHFQVAQILKLLGENSQAEKIINKAIELKPNYQAAINTLFSWQNEK